MRFFFPDTLKYFIFLIILFFILLLGSCSKETDSEQPATEDSLSQDNTDTEEIQTSAPEEVEEPYSFEYPPCEVLDEPHTSCDKHIQVEMIMEGPFQHEDVVGFDPTPRHIHLSYVGDPATSMTIIWATDEDTLAGQVALRDDEDNQYLLNALSLTYEYNFGEGTRRIHEITIDGLTPESTYYYKVGTEGAFSPEYTFRTAPAEATSFTFAVLGDSRGHPDILVQEMEILRDANAQFALHTGDLVSLGIVQGMWDDFFAEWEVFHSLPLMPILGNHEFGAVNYFAQFALPNNERNYSFVYGNVLFIGLDDNPGHDKLSGPTLNFLKQTLEDHQDITWKIVFHHRPPYSSGSHGSQEDLQELWVPLYEEHHVDLVFNGHDHVYERTHPILDNQIVEIDDTGKTEGTTYVVTGGGGAPLYGLSGDWFTAASRSDYHYCILEVNDQSLTLTAKLMSEEIIDSFVLSK